MVVWLLSRVGLFATPWTAACQASLFFTISRNLLRFMSIELVILSLSSSATLFSFCPQSFPASWSFPMSWLCASGDPVVLVVKNLCASAGGVRDTGSIPGPGRSPGGGHGSPLQYSCLETPIDRGDWRATVHGVTKNQTQLSDLAP